MIPNFPTLLLQLYARPGMRQALGPGALGRPRGSGWRGRREGGSGWGTHVNPWLFHFNVWQNSLQKKKKVFREDLFELLRLRSYVQARLILCEVSFEVKPTFALSTRWLNSNTSQLLCDARHTACYDACLLNIPPNSQVALYSTKIS